jgi:hypothetical protein
MATTVTLAYSVVPTGASVAAIQAALSAVPLYTNGAADPVLGALFGLTVQSDTTTEANPCVRTIVLNVTPNAGAPNAPPTFPVQAQAANGEAAIYSSLGSDAAATIDTNPPGARVVTVSYKDAEGNVGSATVNMNGQEPVPLPVEGGTNGIATVQSIVVESAGALGANAGQLTVSVLNPEPPPSDEPNQQTQSVQDALQTRLGPAIAMCPASYNALASTPALQIALLTNFFTQALTLALATQVTAATPVLA